MTAWEMLLAKSSLTVGTAWQHLMSALQLGSGLVINDGILVRVENLSHTVEVTNTLDTVITDHRIVAVVTDVIFMEVEDDNDNTYSG